jgi:hypothetical protein
MDNNIIQIADYSFKITKPKSKWIKDDRCWHKRLTLNQQGNLVECRDCGKQVSAFWALQRFVDIWKNEWEKIQNAKEQLAKLSEEKQYLRVLNEVNQAWRGKNKMAICCPHCEAGILPEDNFGKSQINPKLELARRKNKN